MLLKYSFVSVSIKIKLVIRLNSSYLSLKEALHSILMRNYFETPLGPGICGGLNDRLGQLPTDLHVANMTNRVLFIHWVKPVPLESLLMPNVIDWKVPKGVGFDEQRDMLAKPKFPICGKIEQDCDEMDAAINQAIHGPEAKERVLTFMWVQHINETTVEKRLQALGETDMIHNTPTFGHIFWSFFKLSPGVKSEIVKTKDKFQLNHKSFSILHCRVRHPCGMNMGNKVLFASKMAGKVSLTPDFDLKFTGLTCLSLIRTS